MMKMADRDGEKDELTEVLELLDHTLLTGQGQGLCKSEPSGLETERKVNDMI
jgi:hypothetical protein